MISNRDGQIVHDGRDLLARMVGQIASPVRWDLCMEAMTDLGVTGILEMPPAGTLTGIAKRALKGVDTFALKTPDQLDDARAFCARHGEASQIESLADLADGRLPGQGHLPPRRERRRRRDLRAGCHHRRGGQHPLPAPPSPPPTAARSSSGSSRTATSSPPVNPCCASTRK